MPCLLSLLIRISFDTGRCWSLLDAILAVLIGSQMERKDRALFALSHIYSDHLYTQEAKKKKKKKGRLEAKMVVVVVVAEP